MNHEFITAKSESGQGFKMVFLGEDRVIVPIHPGGGNIALNKVIINEYAPSDVCIY